MPKGINTAHIVGKYRLILETIHWFDIGTSGQGRGREVCHLSSEDTIIKYITDCHVHVSSCTVHHLLGRLAPLFNVTNKLENMPAFIFTELHHKPRK